MPHKIDRQFRHSLRIPRFFKRKDCQQLINVRGDLMHATLVPSPELRADVINNLRPPITARSCLAQRAHKTQVEAGIINTDHGVWFTIQRKLKQLIKEALEFTVVTNGLPDTNHRVLGQVDFQFHPGRFHFRTARAKWLHLLPGLPHGFQ